MKKLYFLGLFAAVFVLGSIAAAYPTFNAQTGMVSLPNALIADPGSIVGAVDFIFNDTSTSSFRVMKGFSSRTEAGAALAIGDTDGVSVSGKYLITDVSRTFDVAAGGSVTVADDDQSGIDLYLVGTATLNRNSDENRVWLGTFGVHFIDTSNDDTIRPFFGAQLPLGSRSQLAGEFQLQRGGEDDIFSVVFRHQPNDEWGLQGGITNASGFGSTSDARVFLGARYTFRR